MPKTKKIKETTRTQPNVTKNQNKKTTRTLYTKLKQKIKKTQIHKQNMKKTEEK